MGLTRRGKRRIGPVLKECKNAHNILTDVENKERCRKQTNSQLSIEKQRLEREMKMKEMQVKLLTTKVDQSHKKDESNFRPKLKREIDQVRRRIKMNWIN